MSTRMTALQIRHLETRVHAAIGKKTQDLIKTLGPRPTKISYTTDQKIQMIRTGKAKLVESVNDRYQYLVDFFSYPMTSAMKKNKEELKAYDETVQQIHKEMADEQTKIMDQAVFYGAEKAFELLDSLDARLRSLTLFNNTPRRIKKA